jgi:hypothetical protein
VESLDQYPARFTPPFFISKGSGKYNYQKGQEVCQIVRVVSNLGGVYKIEYEPTLHLILKTFGLYEIAQHESIEICHTMDGATAGVKFWTKEPLIYA